MDEFTFLGLPRQTWQFINTFAPWFSAAGTITAVCVSLYLAAHQRRPRLKVSAGHRLIIASGMSPPHPQYLVIRVVNTGDRTVRIVHIGWRTGFFRKRYAVQDVGSSPLSSKLPIDLDHGQEAHWYVPMNFEEGWASYFSKKLLLPSWRSALWSLRVEARTSIGFTFRSPIEDTLRNILAETSKSLC